MELTDIIPKFNLCEEYWRTYTKSGIIPPQYVSADSRIERSIIGEGTEIYGEAVNSIIGAGVATGKGAIVRDSIVMRGSVVGEGSVLNKAIIAEDVAVGARTELGVGGYVPSTYDPRVYQSDLVTIGERSVIPDDVKAGKNTAISGITSAEGYPNGLPASDDHIMKVGDVR